MNTQLDPTKVAQLLTQGAQQLDEKTVSALAEARFRALSKQPVRAPSFALTTGRWLENLIPHTSKQWMATGLLAALLVVTGTTAWQYTVAQQISELDVAILTDEMPLEVFVD
jgi:Protein of unknown function (DUF3619)